ncbi:transcription initiation factor TFIID, subunit TAF5 [Hortaea werneckii]|nr:transcription initiation factor TFIID, subunit TAF5 [Hortaea werneckii]
MAQQPPPPSRTGSVGPPSAGGMGAPPATTPGGGGGQNSQQNLNQIVLEYLNKKGYNKTEAMLRKESLNVDAHGQPILTRIEETGGRKWGQSFRLIKGWIEHSLEIYRPELVRLLWPIFVHAFLDCIIDCYTTDALAFFREYKGDFEAEQGQELRELEKISLPEHVQDNELATLYRQKKYRVSLSPMAFAVLVEFLEARDNEGGKVILNLINAHVDVATLTRAATARGLQKLMEEKEKSGRMGELGEDEGIQGHQPGSTNTDVHAVGTLSKLSLAPMPMEPDLMEDVKADLSHEDSVHPPVNGQSTLVDQFEENIKQEPADDAAPNRDQIPFPPSTARDVAMEVQKVKENRDRFRIEGRTGGIGPGLSVTMFTFHNTFDSVNCIEFSGDNTLAAIGTAESYIRVWSLDNRPLISPQDPPGSQPSSSRRLIGHSGPVYALSFSPSAAIPEQSSNGDATASAATDSQPRYMLSCSADSTVRLWSLDTWTNLVVYRSHNSPVWDVRFCPHGHYFLSCSADRTARLWSTPQIAPLRIFVGHDSDVETIAWHPNGAYIFTGSGVGDKTVRVWSIVNGNQVRIFTGHTGNITAISCAPNGHLFASGDDKGEIMLWDLRTGRRNKTLKGHHKGGVWSLDWSVESSVLVSGGADKTVRVWDVQQNKEIQNKPNGDSVTKIDGATVGAASTTSKPGKAKGPVVSPDQISCFATKKSPVYKVRFTQMNLVMAGGAYLEQA